VSLLERDALLAGLDAYLTEVLGGRGRLVFLGGEAGAGKTTLLAAFTELAGQRVRVLRGACDGGTTPRPLGPLADIAGMLGAAVEQQLDSDRPSRGPLFAAVRGALGERPTLFVVEDAHWADDTTLDLVRYLGRRMDDLPLLVVVTYRDDEVGPGHPLTAVLGDLATAAVVARMLVPLLTQGAVAELARRAGGDFDPVELYERTCGNPFFVTEVLAAGTTRLPPSVVDAVHARAARLTPAAREVLAAASVVRPKAEADLVVGVSGRPAEALDECVRRGLLVDLGDQVGFRHELARQAVYEGLLSGTRVRLHRAVYGRLLATTDDRRLAHHADRGGLAKAVVRHAPRAAEQAASLGCHRAAATHYRTALRHGHVLSDAERADLLGRLSYECYLTDQLDEAFATREEALGLHRAAGNEPAVGTALRSLSRLSWFLARNADAHRYGTEAVTTLEAYEPGPELAMAYSNMSQLRMLDHDCDAALAWGERAIELSERLGEQEVLAHALNNVGTTLMISGAVEDGIARLRRSLDIALAVDAQEHVARAYTNLGWELGLMRRMDEAEKVLRTGIAYGVDRDLDSWWLYMQSWLAWLMAERGRHEEAEQLVGQILPYPRLPPITRIPALTVAGVLAVRRGAPVGSALDEAWQLALQTGEPQRVALVAAARAEQAWTEGDGASIGPLTEAAWTDMRDHSDVWDMAELAYWRKVGAAPADPGRTLPEPFASLMDGRPADAANLWADLGCPRWHAFALSRSDDPADVRTALGILNGVGAPATAKAVARDVRLRGVAVREPRPATRNNPAGLTARELEVLQLLARGLSNAELAVRLGLSGKTVGHHVSAVLRKLGVPTRSRAVATASELGILMPVVPPS
jgi:DNA-binding CsgD family transcriptional regulator/tetratricopeptide (TPR) repeat protein